MGKLKVGLDIDGTLTEAPKVFRKLTDGTKLILITGRPESNRKETESYLKSNKIRPDKLFMYPDDADPDGVAEWKADLVTSEGIDIMFDNNHTNAHVINAATNAVAGHILAKSPEKVSKK
jgi:uncharacterized HAD superfamily protein